MSRLFRVMMVAFVVLSTLLTAAVGTALAAPPTYTCTSPLYTDPVTGLNKQGARFYESLQQGWTCFRDPKQ